MKVHKNDPRFLEFGVIFWYSSKSAVVNKYTVEWCENQFLQFYPVSRCKFCVCTKRINKH